MIQVFIMKKKRHAGGGKGQLYWLLKWIKYEIRLGEPNRTMSTGPKKVEPILCVGP